MIHFRKDENEFFFEFFFLCFFKSKCSSHFFSSSSFVSNLCSLFLILLLLLLFHGWYFGYPKLTDKKKCFNKWTKKNINDWMKIVVVLWLCCLINGQSDYHRLFFQRKYKNLSLWWISIDLRSRRKKRNIVNKQ